MFSVLRAVENKSFYDKDVTLLLEKKYLKVFYFVYLVKTVVF